MHQPHQNTHDPGTVSPGARGAESVGAPQTDPPGAGLPPILEPVPGTLAHRLSQLGLSENLPVPPNPTPPQGVLDRSRRLWAWDPTFQAYRHEDGVTTTLKTLGEIQTDCGLTAIGDLDVLVDRYIVSKDGSPWNVFEWCWAHSHNLDHQDRNTLLLLAFKAIGEPPTLHPLMGSWADPAIVGRLVSAGFIEFDNDSHGIVFPAYQAWLVEHEVAW